MTGNLVFISAMELLGYADDANITKNALTYVLVRTDAPPKQVGRNLT